MSHHRTQRVSCNGRHRPNAEPCKAEHAWWGTLPIREADRYVRGKGWHVRPDGRHICPSCWKDGER